MADFSTLIAALQATIKTNYNQEITGQILQHDLLAIVDAVNRLKQDTLEGYAFHGAPLADGASVSVTQNTFFLVAEGEYEINGSTIEVDAAGVSVIVYDSVNDTTNWYTLFAYDTTPTENSRNAITSGAVAAALAPLATKEDVEAVEQEVAQIAGEAGLAEAVIDTDGAGTEQEFTFRKSGGDGGAYYRKIKGKTLAWNQLGHEVSSAYYYLGSASGSVTNWTATIQGGGVYGNNNTIIPTGHKILVSAIIRLGNAGDFVQVAYNDAAARTQATTGWQVVSFLATGAGTAGPFNIRNFEAADWGSVEVLAIQYFDLTLAGIADEISTPAEFEALYPDAYYPYNPGTLISNDAEAVETTGVNQWDEEWEVGSIDSNGDFIAAYSSIRGKNYYPVQGGETYRFTGGNAVIYCYDANKTFIPYTGQTGSAAWMGGIDVNNATFVLPSSTSYIRFCMNEAYGTTYNHDICINLSNPAINGQYFPYWKRTLQLGLTTKEDTDGNVPFADGMKGAGTAADWADKVGGEKRMMRVNLGDLEWVYDSFFRGTLPLNSVPNGAGICSKYPCSNDNGYKIYSGIVDKEFVVSGLYISSDTNKIYIRDTAYTDAATFKAAMNGVFLDFEIATPVPFTWAEPLNLGVKVDENGTERAVAPEGATAPSAPFVADTTYTMSVARMVEILQNL